MGIVELTTADTLGLRHAVLRDGRPDLTASFPGDDHPETFHLGIVESGVVLATSTFIPATTPWRPGRRAWQLRGMAVAADRRGAGLGAVVLRAGFDALRSRGGEVLWANARDTALGFYRRLGMDVVGEQFLEGPAQLPHHVVVLDLVSAGRIAGSEEGTERL